MHLSATVSASHWGLVLAFVVLYTRKVVSILVLLVWHYVQHLRHHGLEFVSFQWSISAAEGNLKSMINEVVFSSLCLHYTCLPIEVMSHGFRP